MPLTTGQRLTAALAATVLVVAVSAQPVGAGTVLDRAADALRRDHVYVDPDAERKISETDANRIRERIRNSGDAVFVAVLPSAALEEAGGRGHLARSVAEATTIRGTYAVVAGDRFEAVSHDLPPGRAGSLAATALQGHRDDGTTAVLLDFVERVQQSRPTTGDSGRPDSLDEGSDGGSGAGASPVLVLLVLGAVGGGGFLFWRRRKREREAREARDSLRPELRVLADDVLAVEPQVTLHPEARPDYDAAGSGTPGGGWGPTTCYTGVTCCSEEGSETSICSCSGDGTSAGGWNYPVTTTLVAMGAQLYSAAAWAGDWRTQPALRYCPSSFSP